MTGGPSVVLNVGFELEQGNWNLLFTDPTDGAQGALGYYPTSIYNNGPMASNSSRVVYGGEVETYTASSSPMGSAT